MSIFKRSKKQDEEIPSQKVQEDIKIEKKEKEKSVEARDNKSNAHNVLIKPLITEKGNLLNTMNQYIFMVAKDTTKNEVKKAIKAVYNVSPISVNIMNMIGKKVRRGRSFGQMKNWKKAFVTLKDGDKIEFFEGI